MNDRPNGAPEGTPGDAAPPEKRGRLTRTRSRSEQRTQALDTSPGALVEEIAQLTAQLEAALQEAADNKSGWQRTAADFANFRRRTDEERSRDLGIANEGLLFKVIGVADDLGLALDHAPPELAASPWVEGVAAIDRKLRQLLESEGVTPIEAVGREFDPREHDAVIHEPTTEVPDGVVLRDLRRGYLLRDRVLRPALVAVARNDGPTQPTTDRADPAPDS